MAAPASFQCDICVSPKVRFISGTNLDKSRHTFLFVSVKWLTSEPGDLYAGKLYIVQPILSSVVTNLIISHDLDCVPSNEGFDSHSSMAGKCLWKVSGSHQKVLSRSQQNYHPPAWAVDRLLLFHCLQGCLAYSTLLALLLHLILRSIALKMVGFPFC